MAPHRFDALLGVARKPRFAVIRTAFDTNQTSISKRKRDRLRLRSGESRNDERKGVLTSVAGAITCAAAGNIAVPLFHEAATLPCSLSAGTMGRNGGELRSGTRTGLCVRSR